MKYCEEFAALLDPYLDGELSPEEMIRVQEHLDHCADCRAYVDDALVIRANFPGVEDTPVPVGFADAVCAAVRAGAAPRKKRTAPWVRALLPLAACLAVVVLLQNGPLSAKREAAAPAAYDMAAAASADAGAEESAAAEPEAPMEAQASAETAASGTASGKGQGNAQTAQNTAEAAQSPAAAPQPYAMLPAEDSVPENGSSTKAAGIVPDTEDGWVEHANVVFTATVCLTPEEAGDALTGYEGKPYSNAERSDEGVIGTGYALEQADLDRILEQLDAAPEIVENQAPTTELCCIVVTNTAD